MELNYKEPSSQILDLPILKHFDDGKGEISLNPKNWRTGEKGLNYFLKLAFFGGLGYLAWVYILPPLFIALGQVIALAGVAVLSIFLILMLPVIFKGLRRLTRSIHKALIKHDPFGELFEQKEKMIKNRMVFKNAKAKIKALKSKMEAEAYNAEKECKDFQEQVLNLQKQAQGIKVNMEKIVSEKGPAGKDTDEYVEYHTMLAKKLSESQRVSHQLEQSKGFISKYGSRANIMGKLDRKLSLAETAIDIKISDFEVTIKMLEKEYEFARTAKAATDSAKSAMMFTKDWELEYALDVITETIALDIAKTQENLSDIDILTSKYDVDSDELYLKLDTLADKIKTGEDFVPEANKYNNPNYKLTAQDKQESGGFGSMFD